MLLDLVGSAPDTVSATGQRVLNPAPEAPKNNDWLQKTQAFTECIFGVGVPIGAAWGIVTNPPLLAYVMRMGPLPATTGGTAYKYIERVRNSCGYALS